MRHWNALRPPQAVLELKERYKETVGDRQTDRQEETLTVEPQKKNVAECRVMN